MGGTVRSIFWSAGDDPTILENSIGYKYDEDEGTDIAVATLKNGKASSYWLGSADAGNANYVRSNGKFQNIESYFTNFINPKLGGGMRPVTKLTEDGIVYAAELGTEIEVDGVNYLEPGEGETYYKLF